MTVNMKADFNTYKLDKQVLVEFFYLRIGDELLLELKTGLSTYGYELNPKLM